MYGDGFFPEHAPHCDSAERLEQVVDKFGIHNFCVSHSTTLQDWHPLRLSGKCCLREPVSDVMVCCEEAATSPSAPSYHERSLGPGRESLLA